MDAENAVVRYLDLLDAQREAALSALDGLSEAQVWQRPAPREWSIGEILNHNVLVIASALPLVRLSWRLLHRRAARRRHRPCRTDIADVYRTGRFPMWVGFLWTPRYNPRRPVPPEQLKAELRDLHRRVREFYTGKDEAVLGQITLYDPVIGKLNLIEILRVGIYHDQLHYDDVIRLAAALKGE